MTQEGKGCEISILLVVVVFVTGTCKSHDSAQPSTTHSKPCLAAIPLLWQPIRDCCGWLMAVLRVCLPNQESWHVLHLSTALRKPWLAVISWHWQSVRVCCGRCTAVLWLQQLNRQYWSQLGFAADSLHIRLALWGQPDCWCCPLMNLSLKPLT